MSHNKFTKLHKQLAQILNLKHLPSNACAPALCLCRGWTLVKVTQVQGESLWTLHGPRGFLQPVTAANGLNQLVRTQLVLN